MILKRMVIQKEHCWQRNRYLRPELPFTGVSGPSGPEIPKNSQESLPGPLGPECPKSLEKSQKVSRKCQNSETFLRLFDSFRDFLDTPGPKARADFLENFLGISGPEGPETPVNGRSGLKSLPNEFNIKGPILQLLDLGADVTVMPSFMESPL